MDPKRVGVSGYSATGHEIADAITSAADRFAAAVLANTDPGSLNQYLSYVDFYPRDAVQTVAEVMAGAKPYGEGIQNWVQNAPGFATNKIRAPVLVSVADPFHLMELWGFYASLRDQGKAVDLQYIRSGDHNIAKPLQKLAHQEMIVDWFDFWLNNHEDSDASKADQYERWHKLREARADLGL
ncbi:MAG TPA: prolyl oligopeptidase family serine peptidase [Steroidobacteraceae bacterium]